MATSDPQHSDLLQALRGFASSPRYNFLKSLQVGPILGDDADSLGAIAEMTFEELVSSIEVGCADLANLHASQERLLITILGALAEGEGEPEAEPNFAALDEPSEFQDEEDEQPAFNSVQCELDLREKLGKVRSHPELDRLKESQLGKFWSSELPRAPFEESLTIKQLLSLDLGMLAKKRSMTSMRMYALARALENALETLHNPQRAPSIEAPLLSNQKNSTAQVATTKKSQRATLSQVSVVSEISSHSWYSHLEICSVAEAAMVELALERCLNQTTDDDALVELLKQISLKINLRDFLALMSGAPVTQKLEATLSGLVNVDALSAQISVVTALLRSPGIHIAQIAKIVAPAAVSPALSHILVTLLVRGAGAQCVSIDGRRCQDVWTLNPKLAQLIFIEARSKQRSRSQSDLLNHLDPVLHTFLTGLLPEPRREKRRHRGR